MPLRFSVTFWENTAPVKLPIMLKTFLHFSTRLKSDVCILYSRTQFNKQDYSKDARGLSVPLYFGGIFTAISISSKNYWRQQSSRYTIHAGQKLSVKGFRYLWTVKIQPPFTGVYIQRKYAERSLYSSGQVSDFIHHISI